MGENLEKQIETLKSRVFFGDKDSTWPTAVKFTVTPKTRGTIENFDKEMSLNNKKDGTRLNYFKCIMDLFFFICNERKIKVIGLEKLDKEDMLDYFQHLKYRGFKPGTVNVHKHVIKRLYKFMDGGEEYPSIVKWIKYEKNKKTGLPKNLITLEQIKQLIACTNTPRDKAIISCLAESGARISELLNVNMDDLTWQREECSGLPIVRMRLVDIKGHTGERAIELFDSVPYLQEWLNEHPDRDNPESPLFISLASATFRQRLGRHMVREILKKAGERAGLKDVTLNPHSFRHRALTENGKFMSKFELAKFAGHTMSSKMVDVYIHLEDDDINNKLRLARGLSPIKKVKELSTALKTKSCSCGETNPPTALFCNRCRKPLDEDMKEKFEKENIAKEFVNFVLEKPEALPLLEKMMRMFAGERQTAGDRIP